MWLPGRRNLSRPGLKTLFRFTIRDVLWLMVVVAVQAAWRLDHDRLVQEAAKLKAETQMQRAVDFDSELLDC